MYKSDSHSSPQLNFFLILITTIAAIGGFLFGYDTGIISGALLFIQSSFSVSVMTQEIIVSSVILGALAGALSSGRLADSFGSQRMLLAMSVTFIAGTLISACAPTITLLILGRFIIGVAIGITSYVSPLFISEMAPARHRGSLVLLNGIMITSGEAIAFLVDYLLVPTQSWRLMFATGLIPAAVLFTGMLLLPATPRWTALKGQMEKSKKILARIRHSACVEQEWNEILRLADRQRSNWSDLFSKSLRPVLMIGLGLGVFQQFIGINTVMYYGPSIFKAAGFQSQSSQILATFCMGMVNTLMSIVSVILIDRVGRRRMLLIGLTVSGASLYLIGYVFSRHTHQSLDIWISFIFMIIYIAGYSMSLGSLFWLVISEIYPLNIRGLAMSFATAAQWAANFIVAATFLSTLNAFGPAYTFWGYACMCIISLVFCYYLVPETRGVSLEQIEHNLRLGKRSRDLGQPISALT
ncbi:Galactose-proton symporter [Aquicella siphonis]|uniref:Galactose-proton symporter n=1 Tax=Aquicella siphonis TaxID=254247 RepID=A0A5E4PGB2_9COXI|nr:sugar porter family MFS transporter [Aquicella siphonis]VVC75487.1 Galactose-proton symporter [Aquicella siphonis]